MHITLFLMGQRLTVCKDLFVKRLDIGRVVVSYILKTSSGFTKSINDECVKGKSSNALNVAQLERIHMQL